MGLGGRDVDLGETRLQDETLGEGGFAGGRATYDQGEGGQTQFSFPKSEPNDVGLRITYKDCLRDHREMLTGGAIWH
jgi:hypothetical protein